MPWALTKEEEEEEEDQAAEAISWVEVWRSEWP
jgi:hypothetical protein